MRFGVQLGTPEAATPEVLAHAWRSVSIVVIVVVVATAMMSVMMRVATSITRVIDIGVAARSVVSRSCIAVLVSIYDVDSVPVMLGLLLRV